jgi:hypothetical protein
MPLASNMGGGGVSSGVGVMAPFAGFGTQSDVPFRGQTFWATETQWRFKARDSDSEAMLGTTDKHPEEKVWYECDFIDVLRGASINTYSYGAIGDLNVLSLQVVSNGEVNHLVRALVNGVPLGETAQLRFVVYCSDGTERHRSLKIRGRWL